MNVRPVMLPVLAVIFLAWQAAGFAAENKAVAIKSSDVILDAKAVATMPAGTQVLILGQSPETNEVLISYTNDSGATVMGLVPAANLVAVTGSAPAVAQPSTDGFEKPAPKNKPHSRQDAGDSFDALGLVEKVRNDRETERGLHGKKIKVTGVIEAATLENVRGQPQQAVVLRLKTAPGMPRLKAILSPAHVSSKEFYEKFNFGPHYHYDDKARVEFRSRSNQLQARSVSEKQYTYTYGSARTYDSTSRSESEWIQIFPQNEHVTVEGTFSGFSMDVTLDACTVL